MIPCSARRAVADGIVRAAWRLCASWPASSGREPLAARNGAVAVGRVWGCCATVSRWVRRDGDRRPRRRDGGDGRGCVQRNPAGRCGPASRPAEALAWGHSNRGHYPYRHLGMAQWQGRRLAGEGRSTGGDRQGQTYAREPPVLEALGISARPHQCTSELGVSVRGMSLIMPELASGTVSRHRKLRRGRTDRIAVRRHNPHSQAAAKPTAEAGAAFAAPVFAGE
jgi:hypothetical protein